MKKMIIFTIIVVSVCLVITLALTPALEDSKQAENTVPATEPVYILKSENDKIVVVSFRSDTEMR